MKESKEVAIVIKNLCDLKIFLSLVMILTSCGDSSNQGTWKPNLMASNNNQITLGLTANNVHQDFYCSNGEEKAYLYLRPQGQLTYNYEEEPPANGSYSINNGHLILNLPGMVSLETSIKEEVYENIVLTLQFNDYKCHSIGHTQGESVSGYIKCPQIKHITDTSYQSNDFEFFNSRKVVRKVWNELLTIPETLYTEYHGIYYINGQKIVMSFGDAKEESFLNGSFINSSSMVIDQLEPLQGACK